jgi:hypothetical protein
MQPGQKIEILGGHLMGIRGELVRHQGTQKVLVKLDIGQGLIFNIDKNMIGSI